MPIHAFPLELKSFSDTTGQFTGLASTYLNRDLAGDVVMPGAFDRTLADGGKERPLLWAHTQPIGKVTLTDSPKGLIAEGQLTLALQLAKDTFALMRDGVIKGLSIGFQTLRSADGDGGIRHLLECKLFEVSLVVFPCNEQATVNSVKSAQRDAMTLAAQDLKDFFDSLRT